jgi:hypothetical protein
MRKYSEWEAVWALQRIADAGGRVSIQMPPKYKPADFRKTSYWQCRGKLDVPKERFISYPEAGRRRWIPGHWLGRRDHLECPP